MKFVIVTIILTFNFLLQAQNIQYISGKISQNTRWSGQIYIDGDIIVQKGVTLSIDSGSRIIFKSKQDQLKSGNFEDRIELIVLGKLLAKGKPRNAKIIFTSDAGNQRIDDWYGIVIKNLNETSILEYCVIEYAYKGITCYGSSPVIDNCEIRFNYIAGISCEVRSNPTIRNTTLFGNDFTGINCELASFPIIENCSIIQNTNGIMIFDRSEPDIGHNPNRGKYSVGGNRIMNNFEYNIYNHSSNDIYAQNNIWNSNSLREINQKNYDREDNPAYGRILTLPLFRNQQRSVARSFPQQQGENRSSDSSSQLVTNQSLNNPSVINSNTDNSQSSPSSNQDENLTNTESNLGNQISNEENSEQLGFSELEKDTQIAARNVVNLEPSPIDGITSIDINQPIIEGLLDGGKREYLRKVKPEYPQIYKVTGHEGSVFMEVVVGKDGRVENYKILKTDGEYFSQSAEEAIKKYIYKPATFKGIPVRFRIIERFKFQLLN